MNPWFSDNLRENNRLRHYTKKRLAKENFLDSFFKKYSVTTWLIILNILTFFISYIALALINSERFFSLFALQADSFFLKKEFYQLITSMFLHAGVGHLAANMISLFFIGKFVEKLIGRKRFFWFYIISGIISGLFFVSLSYSFGNSILGGKLFGTPETFGIGASGAIFGLLGILAIITPYSKVYLIAGPLIAIIFQTILDNLISNSAIINLIDLIVTIYFIFSIFAIFSFNKNLRKLAVFVEVPFWILPFIAIIPLVIIGLIIPLPIGNTAHFGGLITGIFYGIYLKKKFPKKTKWIASAFS